MNTKTFSMLLSFLLIAFIAGAQTPGKSMDQQQMNMCPQCKMMMKSSGGMMKTPMMKGMSGMHGQDMHKMVCPMKEKGITIEVKNQKDGVAIILKSKDPKQVKRLQKKALIVKLLHELKQEMQQEKMEKMKKMHKMMHQTEKNTEQKKH